ncbi:MAG: twin-arginine translocation signal domain-containing protein, partial [Candidatus Binatota bacterium]
MANQRKSPMRHDDLSRREFIGLAGTAAAGAATLSWPGILAAAQPGKKRIVVHTERRITSLGYHNRRDTEHVAFVDAGLAGQNPV